MNGIRDKLDYLLTSFELHLSEGLTPSEAWDRAIEDYAYVYYTDNEGSPLSRAARRALEQLGSS